MVEASLFAGSFPLDPKASRAAPDVYLKPYLKPAAFCQSWPPSTANCRHSIGGDNVLIFR
jgi:hypothetical protein